MVGEAHYYEDNGYNQNGEEFYLTHVFGQAINKDHLSLRKRGLVILNKN